jgi:hypothetical protein
VIEIFKTSFVSSYMRNSLIQIGWWIVFFPGFYSSDSFAAVEMAKTGELENSGTASWALYVRVFSFFGQSFPLLTLFSGLILIYGVTRLSYAMFTERIAALSSFLLTLTPLVAGMGITLWHDIPMTAGFLLIVAFFIHLHRNPENIRFYAGTLLVPGALLISFKPNGLPTLIVFSILMLVLKLPKQGLKYLVVAILVTSSITVIGSNLVLGANPINSYFAQEWMRGDISCYANTLSGQGFVEKEIPGVGNTKKWASEQSCTFLNGSALSYGEKVEAEKFVPMAWWHLLESDPLFILNTHLKRHAYLLPLPIFGIPTGPFLHSTIEFQNKGIEWAFPSIAEKARTPMRLWNAIRGLTGWAGLWLMALFSLALLAKRRELVPVVVMSISMTGILFVVAPIPDGRYVLFVLIAGQLALIGNILKWAQTGSNRRPTD